ncbi:MAG: tyrosine-type recombinase/integrase [Cyanothece sp. SIO1E1]|nr:tyrosine-type recombinase/integrase [Cyanothece sp. SIO1E1]
MSKFASEKTVSQPKRKKAPKGTVSVQVFKERLRLCWSYQSKRYFLYMGLPDSKVNRIVAEGKAKIIEGDIATGNFDSSLVKYKPESQTQSRIKVTELFEKFIRHKTKHVHKRTLEKYNALLGYLHQFFRDKSVVDVNATNAEKFKEWLAKKLAPITLRERITLLNAGWKWGIKQGTVVANPWPEVLGMVKVPPRQKAKPFTKLEIQKILEGFRNNRYYSHYADYVEFLLSTGCRTGEAIGLCWAHLNEDCSVMWIGESLSRGLRKETKNNQERFVFLTPRLQKLLLARRPADFKPSDLVFRSPRGKAIDDHNFRNRAWVSVLNQVGVEYRKPYTTRSTLISHALDQGMSPATVAEMTGHELQTLFRNYAGNVQGKPRLPDLIN